MSTIKFVLDGAKMDQLLHGPAGVVWPWMRRRGEAVRTASIAQAPMGQTGCLKGSIKLRPIEASSVGLSLRIVADTTSCSQNRTSYALFVHETTVPHDIPNAFGWGPTFGIGGRFGDNKFHPGNQHPNHFLSDNLKLFNV
jgi:hypothetical protein